MRRAGNDSGLSAQWYIASIDGGVPSSFVLGPFTL